MNLKTKLYLSLYSSFTLLIFADSADTNNLKVDKVKNPPVIRLWPIEKVGGEANRLKETYRDYRGRVHLCEVKDPTLTVYPAKTDKPATALIYNPGGAYMILDLPSQQTIQKWNKR